MSIIKFSRKRNGRKPFKPSKSIKKWLVLIIAVLAALGLINENDFTPTAATSSSSGQFSTAPIKCDTTRIIDGDTLDCNQTRIRLLGIDAPEMPGHCNAGRKCTPGDPFAAKQYLVELVAAAEVTCTPTERDKYGRTLARCKSGNDDISCKMVEAGHAVKRYANITCHKWPWQQ